jgi:hypothetical protein
MEQIRITCDTKLRIDYRELNGIQGALKMLSRENFNKLRRHILKDGVNFPLCVWKELTKVKSKTVTKWWIVDGHGRHAVLRFLIEEEGLKCEPLPCVEIEAVNLADAKRKVLNASSSFHTMTKDGLYQFMTDLELGIEALEDFELPEIDIPEFREEFYGDPAASVEPEGDPKKVEFDAYQNAAVKQVVLYFSSTDYEKLLPKLDALMERWKLEDYSQVVWKMANEPNRA